MDQESLEILRMVEQGRVSPEQGAQLLEALKTGAPRAPEAGGAKPRFVRVRVDIKGEEKESVVVNANLPIAMADLALKIMQEAKVTRDGETIQFGDYLKSLQGMDISTILQMVKDGAEGKLVDVQIGGDKGEQVKVEVTVD